MHVYALCATCGRHTLLERSLRLFLEQDYQGQHTLLIYNNSKVTQELDIKEELPSNKRVILVNQHIDSLTGERYTSLGAIYNDIMKIVPEEAEIICFWDDDDLFLKNHISEGVTGLSSRNTTAYKPFKSFYRSKEGIFEAANVLEPSIFIKASHIREHGFSLVTTEQHLKWLEPLQQSGQLFVDVEGTPTLIYNWGDTIPTFKTSGDYRNPLNFENYRRFSTDHGDRVIIPFSKESIAKYYEIAQGNK